MKTAQVICAGISYFETRPQLNGDGTPKLRTNGTEISVDVRHRARMGDIVELSDTEFDRLVALEAVREPSSALLPGQGPATGTPFTTPTGTTDEPFPSPIGDPRSAQDLVGVPEVPTSVAEGDPNGDGGIEEDYELDLDTATVEEVEDWIQTIRPTIPQVLEAAADDPAYAQLLIDGEKAATGGNPRVTLIAQLEEIVDGGSSDNDSSDDE